MRFIERFNSMILIRDPVKFNRYFFDLRDNTLNESVVIFIVFN